MPVSEYLQHVGLGDIFALQFILGLAQLVFLGMIHGHQR